MELLPPSSPVNILLLTTFLLISHLPIYGHARVRTLSHIVADKGFQTDCAFDLGDYNFNLCPLAGTATTTTKSSRDYLVKNGDIIEGPSSGTRLYEITLGGIPPESLGLPASCDRDTWVCMTGRVSIETQGREHEHGFLSENTSRRNWKTRVIPVARKQGANTHHGKILASLVIKDTESIGFSSLQLSLDGGEAEGRPQSAEIEMICDSNVDSYLKFINERDGIHSFRWTTRHGCPTNLYMQSSRLSTTADENDDKSEKTEGDDELLPPKGQSTTRRWMAVILVVVVMSVLCSYLFLASPRARHVAGETVQSLSHSLIPILSTAAIKLRPLGGSIMALIPQSFLRGVGKPFRQGSNQLVRWAEEDMALREAGDMMVNGPYGNDEEESWNGVEFSEYIPLTPNPKHGRGKDFKSYGTTPDVETFEQRGIIGGIGRLFGK
ncbi:hypothetical protein BYT27DRAFT_7252845 [Phlegmacium glaucopus]|nr:hypothetical protein BYT27DRAFT_7252845 [Phlegmacium glaucopus]